MGARLTEMGLVAKMTQEPVNTPAPHEWESRQEYLARCDANAAMKRAYPLPFRRRAASERRWAKAKSESQVSIKTEAAEVLLFGHL